MLTLDQTLESLAVELPRIGGDLSPYTLPLVLVFEREIHPYLIAAVQSNAAKARRLSPDYAEQLKTFAQNLTRTGRRSLLVRTLDLLVADAYAVAEPQLGRDYDPTERMPADVRSYVRRTWDAMSGGVGVTWGALLTALIRMHELHTAPVAPVAPASGRYVGERVAFTRACDLGAEDENAIVSTIDGSTMVLFFPERPAHCAKVTTDTDYKFLRSLGGAYHAHTEVK